MKCWFLYSLSAKCITSVAIGINTSSNNGIAMQINPSFSPNQLEDCPRINSVGSIMNSNDHDHKSNITYLYHQRGSILFMSVMHSCFYPYFMKNFSAFNNIENYCKHTNSRGHNISWVKFLRGLIYVGKSNPP